MSLHPSTVRFRKSVQIHRGGIWLLYGYKMHKCKEENVTEKLHCSALSRPEN